MILTITLIIVLLVTIPENIKRISEEQKSQKIYESIFRQQLEISKDLADQNKVLKKIINGEVE